MAQINCLKCKQPIDSTLEQCPHCSERVTQFQRTYSARLIDGKYQILDRLGVGGMGEIFKVRHIHLNELRVIKIMRPNVAADDQGLQRFVQEARTSTQIKHKNLAMLYDFAQLDDGSYYMVWEFIDGTNIQRWIAQNGAMPARLTVEISIQALHGLDHLHSVGLIHRDISPENIMLSQDHHGKLMVKVIDFGIAKSLAEGESGQGLTQTGMFLGKLKYASPEQAGFLKEGEHLDPRSDLYSFGIVMYEMLAGRAPFQATNPHGYILKHVTEKPAPIHEMNPEVTVPAQLEALVFKSLEKSRDNRFPTAADFARSLENIRESVAPDQKYGLGERMVTLSGQKTLQDLPKYQTGQTATMGGAASTQVTQGGTIGSNEATVMDRGVAGATTGARTIGSNEATVVERFATQAAPTQLESKGTLGSAAPTAVEQKIGYGEAAPTLLERQMAPPKKSNVAVISAIAAAVVIVLGIGGYFMTRSRPVPQQQAPVASSASVIATAPAPITPGKGMLLLTSPIFDVEKIVDQKGNSVPLVDSARVELPPGDYKVTVAGNGETKTLDVHINAGETQKLHPDFAKPNLDELEKEISKQ